MNEIPVHTQSDEVSAHPRHVGHRWFDFTMAVSAIFISAISLGVAIEHGRTERDLVAASSWPFLRTEMTNVYGDKRAIEIGVSNGGVGPAKIASYEMFFDGRPVGSPYELFAMCCGLSSSEADIRKAVPNGTVTMSLIDQTVLRPGESNTVLIVPREGVDPGLFAKLDRALYKLAFTACYCSVLDQCWISDLNSINSRAVKSCPAPAHPYHYNQFPAASAAARDPAPQ
jgi:hypothetical protein